MSTRGRLGGRSEDALGSIWRRLRVDLGQFRSRSGVDSGSTGGGFGADSGPISVDLGSTRGRLGVDLGSGWIWSGFGVDLGQIWVRLAVESGSTWGQLWWIWAGRGRVGVMPGPSRGRLEVGSWGRSGVGTCGTRGSPYPRYLPKAVLTGWLASSCGAASRSSATDVPEETRTSSAARGAQPGFKPMRALGPRFGTPPLRRYPKGRGTTDTPRCACTTQFAYARMLAHANKALRSLSHHVCAPTQTQGRTTTERRASTQTAPTLDAHGLKGAKAAMRGAALGPASRRGQAAAQCASQPRRRRTSHCWGAIGGSPCFSLPSSVWVACAAM